MGKKVLGGVIILALFGASAVGSYFLRSGARGDQPDAKDGGPERAAKTGQPAAAPPAGSALRPAVRPPYNPEAESAAQLAANLRNQLEAVRAREQQLTSRHKHLELIYQDIRAEKAAIDEVRKQIADDLKAIDSKLSQMEEKGGELQKQREKVSEQTKELKQTITQVEGVEQERVKQMSTIYDTMDADKAAESLQRMADGGKMDMAVKILATMRERQAARVLAAFEDQAIVVQLLERLKGLKRPAASGQK